jgi:hypothetical protein
VTALVYSVLVWLGWVCPPAPPVATIQPVGGPKNVRPWTPPDKPPPAERR